MTERPTLAARVLAFLLDYLIICLIIVFATGIGLLVAYGPLRPLGDMLMAAPLGGQLLGFGGLTLPTLLYFALSESSARQATWGKRRIGLQVVDDRTGGRPSFGQALGRSALKFLPWELAHTLIWQIDGWPTQPQDPGPLIAAGFVAICLLALGYLLSIVFSRSGVSVYDRLSRTRVVAAAAVSTPSRAQT